MMLFLFLMYSLARTRLRRWGGTWETGGTKYNIIAVDGD